MIRNKWLSLHRNIHVQRINVILNELKAKYYVKTDHFSFHSTRKILGKVVYNNSESKAEFELVKPSLLSNHSDARTTRKYLGMRNEELVETYEILKFYLK